MPQFIHLRVHSEYSVHAGLPSIEGLIAHAKKHHLPALALTDETNLFAAIKFFKAATAAGIKPIFGSDLWLAHGPKPTRFSILCRNLDGFKSLTKLISRAYLQGKRHTGIPVIDPAWLSQESLNGVLVLSGGLAGQIGQLLINQKKLEAKKHLDFWLTKVKPEDFYLEIQRIGQPQEEAYIAAALVLANEYDIPIVATHPSYFLTEEDFIPHEIRVAIHEGYTLEDPNRPKHFLRSQYLCTETEMLTRFADLTEALDNSVELAKRCNVYFELNRVFLPDFPVPSGFKTEDYLSLQAEKGLEERLDFILQRTDPSLRDETSQRYKARLQVELGIINQKGFAGYFLIVADFIQWAKNNDIPVGPGRGSGAGSLVAYAIKITDLDPLPYDLLFERFLNIERVSMPDFDIDFCMDGRDRVIDYVAEKYGRHSVSQIITFGTMAAKAVVRDVGRVLALPYGFVDSVAKLIPLELGISLQDAITQSLELKKRYEDDEEVRTLLDMALKLEGTVRNVGKHAGGVVIAPSDLSDYVPIYCEEGSEQQVAQYDKNDVEAAGLVKFDFLGLRNLTIIQAAVNLINAEREKQGDIPLDILAIALDDPKTYELLKRGETAAVFQFESRGMKDLGKRLKPDCFEDIIAWGAIFRPGPLQSGMVDDFIARKHGHARIEYPHPDTAPILKSTYGVILYQEQVMLIAQVLAGYTLGEADILRAAMGKKKIEEMAKQRVIFVERASQRGIDKAVAEYIFDLMEKFSGYGFNKSHAAAYALVSFQTAYLKAHYPAPYMAAVLSSDMDNTDKVVGFVMETRQLHLHILPPDINLSTYRFGVVDSHTIRYGLGAIKGVGLAAIELIIAEREKGPFQDLIEFCRRLDLRKVNKKVLEALIYSGAMDGLGDDRSELILGLEQAMQVGSQHERNHVTRQDDLFGMVESSRAKKPTPLASQAFSTLALLKLEKQVLGFCLSAHPLDTYRELRAACKILPLREQKPTAKHVTVLLCGLLADIRRLRTKNGTMMAVLQLEDESGRMEVTLFSDLLARFEKKLKVDELILIEAQTTYDEFSGHLRAIARDIRAFPEALLQEAKAICFNLDATSAPIILPQLKSLLARYPGKFPVKVKYQSAKGAVMLDFPEPHHFNLIPESLHQLFEVIGKEHFSIQF